MNWPFLVRKGWEASVNKVIRVMGAPVGEQRAKAIVEDLVAHCGRLSGAPSETIQCPGRRHTGPELTGPEKDL